MIFIFFTFKFMFSFFTSSFGLSAQIKLEKTTKRILFNTEQYLK